MSKVSLYKALQVSYYDKDQAKNYLQNEGYKLNDELSGSLSKVFFNPEKKDLLITYRGSKNLYNDWLKTNPSVAFGGLENTERYKKSYDVYKHAKSKYHVDNPTLIGDSLGGALASSVGGHDKRNKIVTYNKGGGLFESTSDKKNEHAYRQNGDLVSYFTQYNHFKPETLGSYYYNPLKAHDINNLKTSSIFL